MNENLNLVEILKDCPKGTKLYSILFGEVKLYKVRHDVIYIENNVGDTYCLTSDGRYMSRFDGECTLFPSKEQRDWSKFIVKKPKFDPKTLQAFDKVLGRNQKYQKWKCQLFSNIRKNTNYPYVCIGYHFKYCIPYNNETKHLINTTYEAPKFYRYWED